MAISIKTNLVNRAYEFLYVFYYRFIFGRRTSLEEKIKALVHSWEQQRGKGDIPTSKEVWQTQYSKGRWDFLDQLDELAHYSILVGHIQYLKPSGSILDIGCGKGILQQKLAPYGYSRYVGIDISDDAIRQASCNEDDKTTFIASDATSYSPTERFDAIVFNEVLYYFDDPLKTVERYERYL